MCPDAVALQQAEWNERDTDEQENDDEQRERDDGHETRLLALGPPLSAYCWWPNSAASATYGAVTEISSRPIRFAPFERYLQQEVRVRDAQGKDPGRVPQLGSRIPRLFPRCVSTAFIPIAAFTLTLTVATMSSAQVAPQERLCDTAFEDCRGTILQMIRSETAGLDVWYWFMTDWRYSSEIIKRWQAGVT